MNLQRSMAAAVFACLMLTMDTAAAAELMPQVDPLRSPGWRWMAARYFDQATVRFDERVRVTLPASAENPLEVPVHVEVDDLQSPVEEILVFADLNPITTVLRYQPIAARPALAFRFKVQQATPVRAAVRTADGIWHVGGAWIDAAGGGCTAPSVASASGAWSDRIGEVAARLWSQEGGRRLRFRVMHPMDTGLADGIPAFYIERAQVHDGEGALLAELELFEPISENPLITLDLHGQGAVKLRTVDTQGNRVVAEIGG